MLEVVLNIPFWLEFAAALTGGISGAMSAVRARFDIFGTVGLAITTGLFGGIMRDLLLQDYGIYAFQRPLLIISCVAAGVLVFFFRKLISHLDPILDLMDNLSCGLWAVISVGKALSAGLTIIPSIVLGTITAIGGGVMRDILMNKQPEAFQAGALYGSASLIGSIVFAVLKYYHLLDAWSPFIGVGIILAIRYTSLIFGLYTKPSTDYSDIVTQTVSKPVKAVVRKAHIDESKMRAVVRKFRIPRIVEKPSQDSQEPKTHHIDSTK
ncbi:MAG: TRIC cation channel family protein [Eggerthellaceae bacterium]|nr:TRIC cation channel family protein [Eggerthellaceae bacterium]